MKKLLTVTVCALLCIVPAVSAVNAADTTPKPSLTDVTRVLQHIAGWESVARTAPADADGNGKINLNDAALMLKQIAGWEIAESAAAAMPEPEEGKLYYFDIPGVGRIEDRFTGTDETARGETLYIFGDEYGGAGFVLTGSGGFRGATVEANSTSNVNADPAKILSDGEAADVAGKILTANVGEDHSFVLVSCNTVGNGGQKSRIYMFIEQIGGFYTENSLLVTVNSIGKVYTLNCINDIDYGALDTDTLAAVTDKALIAAADLPAGAANAAVSSKYVLNNSDTYMKNNTGTDFAVYALIEYTSAEGDAQYAEAYHGLK